LLRSGRWDDPINGIYARVSETLKNDTAGDEKTPQRRKRAAIFCLRLATERPRKGRASGKFYSYLDDERAPDERAQPVLTVGAHARAVMQTIDSYVIYSSTSARRRPRRRWAPLAAVAMFAAVAIAAGFAFLGRAGDPSMTASRSKLDARVVAESSAALRSDDEARIAAFQESAAISHLTPAAFVAGADEPQTAESGAKPTGQPPRKPAQKPAPKSALVATPVPQPRPSTPEVIMADLPPVPQAAPAPSEAKPGYFGTIAQDVERAPGEVQDFARAMTDRVLGGLSDVRMRVGL
jgi:hypothetical protein